MHRLSPIFPGIYLSSYNISKRRDLLVEHGITHVINLSEHRNPHSDTFTYLKIDLPDYPDSDISQYFEQTSDFICQALSSGGGVLINCWAGMSRAPTILLAFLITRRGLDLDTALHWLQSRRSVVDPNPGFIEQLGKLKTKKDPTPSK